MAADETEHCAKGSKLYIALFQELSGLNSAKAERSPSCTRTANVDVSFSPAINKRNINLAEHGDSGVTTLPG